MKETRGISPPLVFQWYVLHFHLKQTFIISADKTLHHLLQGQSRFASTSLLIPNLLASSVIFSFKNLPLPNTNLIFLIVIIYFVCVCKIFLQNIN